MDEMGLAQQAASQGSGAPQGMPTVEEVVQLLMQGIKPEELLAAGLPRELVEKAMAMVQQMTQQQGPQAAMVGGQGLAQQAAMGGV